MNLSSVSRADVSLEYSREKFVDRSDEIKKVQDIIADLTAGRSREKRALALVSESGTGKTWLLRHLAEEAITPNGKQLAVGQKLPDKNKGIRALYFNLGDWKDGPEGVTKSLIVALSHWVASQMKAPSVAELGGGMAAPLGDLSLWLEIEVRRFTEQRVLALLFDQVYESPWELLDLLDRHLFGPLAGIPRTVIVLAGRGRGYPWLSPELRYRYELVRLGPLDKEQAFAQIGVQVKEKAPLAEEIYELSRGYPRRNYLIARYGAEAGLEEEVKLLLGPVLGNDGTRVRTFLDALCVLQTFDEDRFVTMVRAYYAKREVEITGKDAIELRNRLVSHDLARWDDAAGGWMLDECLRSALEDLLELKDPVVWQRLHHAALELYEDWAERYRATAGIWREAAAYHAQALTQAAERAIQAADV